MSNSKFKAPKLFSTSSNSNSNSNLNTPLPQDIAKDCLKCANIVEQFVRPAQQVGVDKVIPKHIIGISFINYCPYLFVS